MTRSGIPPAAINGDTRPRLPIEYCHTKAIDTFYELPKEELLSFPGPVQQILRGQAGHKLKIRVTRDQTTKAVLAKIIKARIADLHVFSPKTHFDWRVSVSLEMDWDGDLDQLVASGSANLQKSSPDRIKDRMSYTHTAYQIDLTKVTSTQGEKSRSNSTDTHELEIEVSSDDVRQQGKLAGSRMDNTYELLVQGFADNVRTLARLQPF